MPSPQPFPRITASAETRAQARGGREASRSPGAYRVIDGEPQDPLSRR